MEIGKLNIPMPRLVANILVLATAAVVVGCGAGSNGSKAGDKTPSADASKASHTPTPLFEPTLAPNTLSAEEQTLYLNLHYWDKFDFNDTLFIEKVDKQHILSAYIVYVERYVPDSLAAQSLSRLMLKAQSSRKMYDFFLTMGRRVLYDANSPYRNDEKYIPILESAINSTLLSDLEKQPYREELKMALQNRVGRGANDFNFTTADGRTHKMSQLRSEHLLLFFSNPGCPMCRSITEQLQGSPKINEMLERKELRILVVYPDADLEAWRAHLGDYPAAWINSYDKGKVISEKGLYDLKAIPALYLLDSEKRVLAKDCTSVEYIEHLLLSE